MKKIISILMVMCLGAACVIGLSACDSNSGKGEPATAQVTQETPTTQEAVKADDGQNAQQASDDMFTFTFKGTAIDIKADAAPVLEALGECKSYTEEQSCAFDGLDKNYVFSSFILTTYPDGDTDRINSVTLQDDTVSTSAGICIGDPQEKVEEAYGADAFNGVNAFIMEDETKDSQLTVIVSAGKVSSIQYVALFD